MAVPRGQVVQHRPAGGTGVDALAVLVAVVHRRERTPPGDRAHPPLASVRSAGGQPMSDSLSTPPSVRDRTAGLVVFGIFELVLGSCCSLMFPFTLLGLLAGLSVPASQPPPPLGALVLSSSLYGGLGAFFITMGVGSIRARRWAR